MDQPADRPSPRILIVDDQLSNVRLLEHTLRRAGYLDLTSTTDPRTVAALHLEHRYDLILLDLQMPDLNGFQVMQQ
jgi:CheY-like chemotaxis protein